LITSRAISTPGIAEAAFGGLGLIDMPADPRQSNWLSDFETVPGTESRLGGVLADCSGGSRLSYLFLALIDGAFLWIMSLLMPLVTGTFLAPFVWLPLATAGVLLLARLLIRTVVPSPNIFICREGIAWGREEFPWSAVKSFGVNRFWKAGPLHGMPLPGDAIFLETTTKSLTAYDHPASSNPTLKRLEMGFFQERQRRAATAGSSPTEGISSQSREE
jgi:hypothetical protein